MTTAVTTDRYQAPFVTRFPFAGDGMHHADRGFGDDEHDGGHISQRNPGAKNRLGSESKLRQHAAREHRVRDYYRDPEQQRDNKPKSRSARDLEPASELVPARNFWDRLDGPIHAREALLCRLNLHSGPCEFGLV
jgi:hypothetical protein